MARAKKSHVKITQGKTLQKIISAPRYNKLPNTNRKPQVLGISLLLAVIFSLLLVFVFRVGSDSVSASGGGGSVPTGYGSLNHPKGPCGNTGQAACAPIDPGWFSVAPAVSSVSSDSALPDAIATAIMQSNDFVSRQNHYGYKDLDVPALVHAASFAHIGKDYYDDDHWVVSVRDASGMRCGVFDFVYDRINQRMRFSSYGVITPQDVHSQQAFPYTNAASATAQLQLQKGIGMMTSSSPELMFFPIDPNFTHMDSPVHLWGGGGHSPMEPMWHVVGADGHDYFVGIDAHVYTQENLPVAKGGV